MATKIAAHTKIKDVLNMIDIEGHPPALVWQGSIWIIDTSERELGTLVYTKFDDASSPVHSCKVPFSFAHSIGEIIMRGEGLREKKPPFIITIPPEAFSII